MIACPECLLGPELDFWQLLTIDTYTTQTTVDELGKQVRGCIPGAHVVAVFRVLAICFRKTIKHPPDGYRQILAECFCGSWL